MSTGTAIQIKRHDDGNIIAIAPAAIIRPAYNRAVTLTATHGKVAGDRIRLSGKQRYGNQGWDFYPDALTIQHPEHGEVIAAYVDTSEAGLADAPQIRAILGRAIREAGAAEDRAVAYERKMTEGDR